MLNEFIDYLLSEVANGSIYVIGGQGQRGAAVTERWIRTRESASAANAERAVAFWKKQVQRGYGATLGAFDCSGLGMYFLQDIKGLYPDRNANGMLAMCRRIERKEVKKGDWVFKTNNGRAEHIGFALDNQTAIEARGRDYGVVSSSIDARGFDTFGRPEVFAAEIEAGTDIISRVLQSGSMGSDVIALQIALIKNGYSLNKYGHDGKFGAETEKAVKALQKTIGAEQTGIAGRRECEALGLAWVPELPECEVLLQQAGQTLRQATAQLQAVIDDINELSGKLARLLQQ